MPQCVMTDTDSLLNILSLSHAQYRVCGFISHHISVVKFVELWYEHTRNGI